MASIDVCIRFRPFINRQEQESNDRKRIFLQEKYNQVKRVQLTQQKQKIFKFNHVISAQTTNQELYEKININKLVQRVVQGYHSTIFAYGQTGSGKTYTIEGADGIKRQGITSRSIKNLFQMLKTKQQKAERGYKIYLSFIQIYNQNIYDLLDVDDKRPLKMRWNKLQQFTVEGMFEVQCRTAEEALQWWLKGQRNKIMGSHQMNSTSSRSHSLLTIRVQNYSLQDPSQQIESKLQLIDLAGSQRYKLTKSTGVVFKQGIQINKSLFTLRQVITSLYENNTNGKGIIMAPYRDSKLTSLLKHSIGGNSYCMMIACLNPSPSQFQQSLQTLTYASMATFINNVPVKNIDPKMKQNQFLKQQNNQLRKQISKLQQHVKLLTHFIQSNQCKQCKFRKNDSSYQSKESKQPLGILHMTKNLQNHKLAYINSQLQSFSMQIDRAKNSESPKDHKTLKSAKQIIQSIEMIRELISNNSNLRQSIDNFKAVIERQEKEMFNIMKQNNYLRQRCDLADGNRFKSINTSSQALNEKIEKIKQKIRPERIRLNSLNDQLQHRPIFNSKPHQKLSYNQLLNSSNNSISKDKIKYHRIKYNMQRLQ